MVEYPEIYQENNNMAAPSSSAKLSLTSSPHFFPMEDDKDNFEITVQDVEEVNMDDTPEELHFLRQSGQALAKRVTAQAKKTQVAITHLVHRQNELLAHQSQTVEKHNLLVAEHQGLAHHYNTHRAEHFNPLATQVAQLEDQVNQNAHAFIHFQNTQTLTNAASNIDLFNHNQRLQNLERTNGRLGFALKTILVAGAILAVYYCLKSWNLFALSFNPKSEL